MRAALLNLARTELETQGFISSDTRLLLRKHGVTSAALEQYLALTGANTGG